MLEKLRAKIKPVNEKHSLILLDVCLKCISSQLIVEKPPCKSLDGMLQALVVRRLGNATHWINRYPVDSVVCVANTNTLESDLSGGWRYLPFEQLGPG